jgi:hypothetical protein
MWTIEFYRTRDDYENRSPDSTFNASDYDEAQMMQTAILKNNPGAVVSIGT